MPSCGAHACSDHRCASIVTRLERQPHQSSRPIEQHSGICPLSEEPFKLGSPAGRN